QTGRGRAGTRFGCQQSGVPRDIVTMAKAVANGVPIGACWARSDVAAAFRPGDHATTFGGQPLAASAALATLEVMETLDVPRLAAAAGEWLTAKLETTPDVVAVRGAGLLIAAELAEGVDAKAVAAHCL